MNDKKNFLDTKDDELLNLFNEWKEPGFRLSQISEWIWQKNASTFEEMTNIPKKLKNLLSENFFIPALHEYSRQKSSDGTIKVAFQTQQNRFFEAVLIPAGKRMTACVSSQVGCSLTCKFCATGQLGLIRQLKYYEIALKIRHINQLAQETYGLPLTNIVFMGMGEPLLNYSQVKKAIEIVTHPKGYGFSAKRITLSTAGIAKMIKKMADDGVKFNLALSLHAADDEKRNKIMPINEHNNLSVLRDALRYFYEKTGNKITLEYLLLKDFNDSPEDARKLLRFASNIPCMVNIIEYNPVEDTGFEKPAPEKVKQFQQFLENKGLIAKIRRSRGKDIDAACGQLAAKTVKQHAS